MDRGAWRGLQSMLSQRVEHNLVAKSSGTSNCCPLPNLSQQAEGLISILMFQHQAWASASKMD